MSMGPPPSSTLFPYTTLFRSNVSSAQAKYDQVAAGSTQKDIDVAQANVDAARAKYQRSEEHTSELQSRQYLVCRLLLEKKNASNVLSRDSMLEASSTTLAPAS